VVGIDGHVIEGLDASILPHNADLINRRSGPHTEVGPQAVALAACTRSGRNGADLLHATGRDVDASADAESVAGSVAQLKGGPVV